MEKTRLNETLAWEALDKVKDPEIPVISVVDLGIITSLKVTDDESVFVEMTPTFAGCPAIHHMEAKMKEELIGAGFANVNIKVHYNIPWSSNMISAKGKQLLKDFGLSPPPGFDGMLTLDVLQNAICPRCNSNNTRLLSPFGPTACRAIHHCDNCAETFEQFKPL